MNIISNPGAHKDFKSFALSVPKKICGNSSATDSTYTTDMELVPACQPGDIINDISGTLFDKHTGNRHLNIIDQ